MLKSYLFIPGDIQKYINNTKNILADYFVFDLEDSVSKDNKQTAFENIKKLDIKNNYFIRIPFFEKHYTKSQISFLIQYFEGRIVIPKIKNINDLENVLSINSDQVDFSMILLVENPKCFINLKEILGTYDSLITAVGFGSHDFCTTMKMKHNLNTLKHYKKQLILLTKAYEKSYIDTVDLNLSDFSNFSDECIYAFENGADAKFIIHPFQLDQIKSIIYFSEDEMNQMKKVFNIIQPYGDNDIDVFKVDGAVYEKPHVLRITEIFKKLNL